jgi:hypothetical protein
LLSDAWLRWVGYDGIVGSLLIGRADLLLGFLRVAPECRFPFRVPPALQFRQLTFNLRQLLLKGVALTRQRGNLRVMVFTGAWSIQFVLVLLLDTSEPAARAAFGAF